MGRRLLIIVNVIAIVAVAWMAITALTDLWEPVVAPGLVKHSSLGLLLISAIVLIALGCVDARERLLDIAFGGKRPVDNGLFRFLRLTLKAVNVITALLILLTWAFAWFYMREQLPWAVVFTGFMAGPAVCLDLLMFFRDWAVVRNAAAVKSP